MLIDILSTDNMISFNYKLAEMIGLHAAIYLNELININQKAIKKNKIYQNINDDKAFFVVDRKYITSRTTLKEKEQKELDKQLENIKLLYIAEDSDNKVNIDLNILAGISECENKAIIDTIQTVTKKRSKGEVIIDGLKASIETQNEELRDAYGDWIDAVYAKQGWMSKKSVQVAQTVVDDFANHDLDIALKLLEIASTNGYRDMQWAVNYYNEHCCKNIKRAYTKKRDTIQLSGESY